MICLCSFGDSHGQSIITTGQERHLERERCGKALAGRHRGTAVPACEICAVAENVLAQPITKQESNDGLRQFALRHALDAQANLVTALN